MTRVKLHQGHPIANLLDKWFQEIPGFLGREFSNVLPNAPVNIVETAEAYHLELSAPGRNKEDFSITLENGLLTISYEQKTESVEKDLKVVRREFAYPSFKRTFTVDDKIESSTIQGKYEAGLLKLLLPKKVPATVQPQQI